MPIFEYQCDTCGAQREMLLKHGEVARPTCATCRKRMRRVISRSAFILKGSGWYVTDYPSDARKQGMKGEKPAPPAAAENKVAAAAEKKTAAGEKKETGAGAKGSSAADKKQAVPTEKKSEAGKRK
jgi:putative FmdB family regulatory protein